MGFVGSLFGNKNAQNPNLQNPLNAQQGQQAYNSAQNALTQQQNFVNALNGINGIGNQQNVYNQLQGVANGTGPNPAQAMLNQQTGQNVATQGALMAGQRGAAANPGLIARQAAQQGAAAQQQAVGQGAALQANQSLGALGQLGGLANQQVSQQQQGIQGLNQFSQGQESAVNQQLQAQNNAALGNAQQQNQYNLGMVGEANNASGFLQKTLGGAFSGGSAGAGAAGGGGGAAQGGMAGADFGNPIGPKSAIGMAFAKSPTAMAEGGKVPAKVSPGEIYLPPAKAKAVAQGKASPLSGQRIPGKAKAKGDSYANDTVNKTLEAGGVVIPRSKALGDDVHKKAADFVRAVMAHQGMKR